MALIGVVVCLAIGVLIALARFGFPRSSRVGFLGVPLPIGGFVDLMGARIESLAIAEEVSGTRKLKKMTTSINISTRILRLKVVNNIVHGRRKSHKKVAGFGFLGLKVLKARAIR